MTIEHLKDGEAGGELLFELESVVVGKKEDGEEVTGGLVVESDLSAPGESGRPKRLNDRQLRVLQELRKEATSTKKWDFTSEDFNKLCIRSGAVDHQKPENQQRARFSDLKMQLANKGLIAVDGEKIRLVLE